jgi:hypothetical protein
LRYANGIGLNGDSLVRCSRLAARVDNNAIADGFQLYLHGFIVAAGGEWTIVQQGMNGNSGMARRYHWHSPSAGNLTIEPHTGVVGKYQGTIMNLVAAAAAPAQQALLEVVQSRPEATLASIRKLTMPKHHDLRLSNVDLKRLGAVLAVAYEREFHDFASLLLLEKLGPRTLQSLALVAEVVHETPTHFSDPARFSFALGGKDGHPFPVPLKTYDETIDVMRHSLEAAKIGNTDKIDGLRRLDRFVQVVERSKAPEANFGKTVAREREISSSLDGAAVGTLPAKAQRATRQLSLF